MLVRDHMTPNPVTITPQHTVADAFSLLRENKIRRLPIVDKGKLVGIITDRDLREVSPSPATSLSIFEINYLLSKMTIDKVIKKQKLITIGPDAYLEEAALLMRQYGIGALPVVEDGKLVGIITESNIFDALSRSWVCTSRAHASTWGSRTSRANWPRSLIPFSSTAVTCPT